MDFSLDFSNDPRYQALVQKMAVMPPEKRAIINSLRGQLDSSFAGLQVKQGIDMLSAAADRERMKANLGLTQKRLELDRSRMAADLALNRPSAMTDILGLANVGLAGGLGYMGMKETERQSGIVNEMLSATRTANQNIAASLTSMNSPADPSAGMPVVGYAPTSLNDPRMVARKTRQQMGQNIDTYPNSLRMPIPGGY